MRAHCRTVKEFSVDESMQVRPDWAMVGVRDGEWCYIYASSQLLSGELSTEMDYGYSRASLFVAPTYTITMSVNMRTYVIVRGHSYGECMARLMETWNPDESPQELSGTRALGESA